MVLSDGERTREVMVKRVVHYAGGQHYQCRFLTLSQRNDNCKVYIVLHHGTAYGGTLSCAKSIN